MSGCGEQLMMELKPLELNAEFTDMLNRGVAGGERHQQQNCSESIYLSGQSRLYDFKVPDLTLTCGSKNVHAGFQVRATLVLLSLKLSW